MMVGILKVFDNRKVGSHHPGTLLSDCLATCLYKPCIIIIILSSFLLYTNFLRWKVLWGMSNFIELCAVPPRALMPGHLATHLQQASNIWNIEVKSLSFVPNFLPHLSPRAHSAGDMHCLLSYIVYHKAAYQRCYAQRTSRLDLHSQYMLQLEHLWTTSAKDHLENLINKSQVNMTFKFQLTYYIQQALDNLSCLFKIR